MPSFEDARRTILAHTSVLGEEQVALLDARGRVLSRDVIAPWDLPLCDYSAMDGYAVRAADCTGPPLKVTGYLPAGGTERFTVEEGCAVRIMTGAPVPEGADAVIPIEETDEGRERVLLHGPVTAGQHIRVQGQDVRTGAVALPAGTCIRPPEISILASMGKALAPVRRRPRVAILSTGDELMELGETPVPGRVINSNALSLAAAVAECGADPVVLGIARDDRESLTEKISAGLGCDALITSAGVSAGDRDLVRDILAELGATQHFWKIDMKPGGPTAFASREGTPVFSLPGNPVSTMITFELLVKPSLLKMQGHVRVLRTFAKGVMGENIWKKGKKLNFLRVRIVKEGGRYLAFSSGNQHTGVLTTMVSADALAVLPPEVEEVAAGSEVDLIFLNDMDLAAP